MALFGNFNSKIDLWLKINIYENVTRMIILSLIRHDFAYDFRLNLTWFYEVIPIF